MMSIWKYRIPIESMIIVNSDSIGEFTILMPRGSRTLCVQIQGDAPHIWTRVDTEAELEPHSFTLVGTGHKCDGTIFMQYIGTFQMASGNLVFHLFE